MYIIFIVDTNVKQFIKYYQNTSSKSLQWSERNKSDIPKLAEKLMHDSDNEEENCQPNVKI